MTATLPRRRFLAAPLLVAIALPGCGSRSEVIEMLDPASAERLVGITPDMEVVLAARMDPLPDVLALPEGGSELMRDDGAVLFSVPFGTLEDLEGFGNAEAISVWGSAANVGKMDRQLQVQLLESWAGDPDRELSMMARFREGTGGIRDLLNAAGVKSRTVAGPVVTVTGDANGVLRMIRIEALETLRHPRPLEPNR